MQFFRNRAATQQNDTVDPKQANINVLMCAGRRVGKTAIMAAIAENTNAAAAQNTNPLFSTGKVMFNLSQYQKGGTDYLGEYTSKRITMFSGEWRSPFYYAEESTQKVNDFGDDSTSSSETVDYSGAIYLQMQAGKKAQEVATVSFKDPRGEDYTTAHMKDSVTQWMRSSQIILMMVDMPRLMEYDNNYVQGGYHDEFNKPEEITNLLIDAWSGNTEPRMVLFVPVKCELYMAQERTKEMLEAIQKGYDRLLRFLASSKNSHLYTVAIAPCETMGGLEFRKFVPYLSKDGKPTGGMRSVYAYRRDAKGQRYFAPQYCEQLVLYIMRYIFGLRIQEKNAQGVFRFLSNLPKADDLQYICREIDKHMIRDEAKGFYILKNPQGFLY